MASTIYKLLTWLALITSGLTSSGQLPPFINTGNKSPTTSKDWKNLPQPVANYMDAISEDGNNSVVIFSGDSIIIPSPDGRHSQFGLNQVSNWPANWHRVDATLFYKQGQLLLFNGNEYVVFDLSSGIVSTNSWPGLPAAWNNRITAAVRWDENQIALFNGISYILYSFASQSSSGPMMTTDWQGWPAGWRSFNGAVNTHDGFIHFFRRDEYLLFDFSKKQCVPGYPRKIGASTGNNNSDINSQGVTVSNPAIPISEYSDDFSPAAAKTSTWEILLLKNIDWLGASFDMVHVDPLKYNNHSARRKQAILLQPSDRTTADNRHFLHYGTSYFPGSEGRGKEGETTVFTVTDLKSMMSNNYHIDASLNIQYGLGSGGAAFSYSASVKNVNHEQTGKEKIYLYRTIRRELHNTELKFLWQEEDGRKLRQKLTLEFRNAVRDLPTSQNTAAYEQFISNYGTDISTRVRFGGQYVSSTSITKEFYERTGLTQTEFQAKASAMIGYAGSSASIGGGVGNREEKLRREFNKLNTSETTITVSGGAGITKEDEWERALENDPVPVFIEFASIAKLLTKEFFPKDPAIQQKQDLLIQALNYYFQKNGLQDKTAGADKNKFFAKAPRYYKVQPIGVRLDANDRKNGLNNFNYESVHLELKDADGTTIRRIPMDEARFVNRAEYKYFPLNEFKVGGTDRYLYSGIITVDGSIGDKNDVRNPLGPCKTCEDGVIDLGSLYQVGASVTGSMLYSGGKVPVYFSFKVTRISKDEFDQPVSSVQPPSHYNNTPLWRLYNGNAQNHFYTTSEVEVNGAKSIGYTGDGFIECYVLKSPQDDAVPLYRLFNPRVTDHYYTVNESEKNALVSQHGWSYEGIACYIFSSQVPGTVPLYSLYMGGSVQDHFYTTSPKEVEVAVTQIGFTLDNAVIGYVYPAYDIRNNK